MNEQEWRERVRLARLILDQEFPPDHAVEREEIGKLRGLVQDLSQALFAGFEMFHEKTYSRRFTKVRQKCELTLEDLGL
jgi:hypothetical protein